MCHKQFSHEPFGCIYSYDPFHVKPEGVVDLQLLEVCRSIYAEACFLPFSLNAFWSYLEWVTASWVSDIPAQMAAVRTARLYTLLARCSSEHLASLRLLDGLKRVEIVVRPDDSIREAKESQIDAARLERLENEPKLLAKVVGIHPNVEVVFIREKSVM